jgi:hypothetical protein
MPCLQMFLSYVLSPLVLSQCVQMLILMHTGNYKPGRMVVGQTFTIGMFSKWIVSTSKHLVMSQDGEGKY